MQVILHVKLAALQVKGIRMISNEASRIWLFDYDLTLYGEDERFVLDSLDKRIALFVQKTLNVNLEEAQKVRKEYWAKYGTTLAGLQALHGVQPNDFFDFIHVRDNLIFPRNAPQKRQLLLNLKGKRYVFTNARRDWSDAGLANMGISDCFDGVMDLLSMHWEGKPSGNAYLHMEHFLETEGVFKKGEDPSRIILLEDSIANLAAAHHRGWTTILVSAVIQEVPSWVNYHITDITKLMETVDAV